MRGLPVGNKPGGNNYVQKVRNAESSSSIPRGTPLVLNISTTANAAGDGMDVVLPATAGNVLSYGLKYGIAMDVINSGQYGESLLVGYSPYTLITRATRAASTDSWTSSASQASGVVMNGIDTLNNAFLTAASSAASLASNAPHGVLLDSIASMAASATATSDSRTAITAAVRSFVRML